MAFNLPVHAPNPLLLRPRSPWLPKEVSEMSISFIDENHHTTGYLTFGTFINFGRYELISLIGRGAFGAVVLAQCQATGEERAVKFLNFNKDGLGEVRNYNILYEKPDLTKIPLIENIFRIFHNGVPYICIVMQPLGPNLHKTVHKLGAFTIPFATLVMRNVLEGFQYLHETVGIAHLDVSPSNIVFRDNFDLERGQFPQSAYIRIIDFNSCHKHGTFDNRGRFISAYRAPEVCLLLNYTWSADIWALGSLAFFLVQQEDFFPYDEFVTDIELINAHARFLGPIPKKMLAASKRTFVVRSEDGTGYNLIDADLPVVKDTRILENFFNVDNEDDVLFSQLIRACYTLDFTTRPKAAKLLFDNPIFQRHLEPVREQPPAWRPPSNDRPCSLPALPPEWATSFPHFIAPNDAVPNPDLIPMPVQFVMKKIRDSEWMQCRGLDSPDGAENAAGPSQAGPSNAPVGQAPDNRPGPSFPSDPIQSQPHYPHTHAQQAVPIVPQPIAFQFCPMLMPIQAYPSVAQVPGQANAQPHHFYQSHPPMPQFAPTPAQAQLHFFYQPNLSQFHPALAQANHNPFNHYYHYTAQPAQANGQPIPVYQFFPRQPYYGHYAPLACLRDPRTAQFMVPQPAPYPYSIHYVPAACARDPPTMHLVPNPHAFAPPPPPVPVQPQPYPFAAQHAPVHLVPHLIDVNTLMPISQSTRFPPRVVDITAWSQEYRERFNTRPPATAQFVYPTQSPADTRGAQANQANPAH